MYTLNYYDGKVCSIQRGHESIPISPGNKDFDAFVRWNREQKPPLDLLSTIPTPTQEQDRDLQKVIDVLIKAVDVSKLSEEDLAIIKPRNKD